MKLVIAHKSGEPRVVDVPEPRGGKNHVTVRLSHCGMTLPHELDLIARAPKSTRRGDDGIPLGGSASGIVAAVGPGVKSIKEGIRVAVSGARYVYHAGQVVVPEHCVVELPKKVNHEEGAFAGQGAAALHVVRTARVQIGEVVLVFGADLIGLLAAQLVRAAGGTPILIDESEFRINKMHSLGITHTFLPTDDELVRTIQALTFGEGADSALLTTIHDATVFSMACMLLRHGGVAVIADEAASAIPANKLREKSITLLTAEGGGAISDSRWNQRDNMACLCSLLAERKIQISPIITDRVPLERAPTIYEKAQRNRDAVIACVLTV